MLVLVLLSLFIFIYIVLLRRKYPVPHWIQVHGKINDSHSNLTEIESARVCIAHARTTFFSSSSPPSHFGLGHCGGGGDFSLHMEFRLWNYTDPTSDTFVPTVFYRLPSRTLNFEHSLECKTTTTTNQNKQTNKSMVWFTMLRKPQCEWASARSYTRTYECMVSIIDYLKTSY